MDEARGFKEGRTVPSLPSLTEYIPYVTKSSRDDRGILVHVCLFLLTCIIMASELDLNVYKPCAMFVKLLHSHPCAVSVPDNCC